MKEFIHSFGEFGNLTGISTVPDTVSKAEIVVLMNAGVVHKVGPFRLNVDIARELCKEGYIVFRFDLSGLGDSAKIKSNLNYYESTIKDFQYAFDFLSEHMQKNRFIVAGLCTGADNAHKIAVKDQRVVGVICLDGYGYPTSMYYWLRLKNRIGTPAKFVNTLIQRTLGLFIKKPILPLRSEYFQTDLDVNDYVWNLPQKTDFIKDMQLLFSRSTHLLYVYSGGVSGYYLYKEQFHDVFKGYEFCNVVEVHHSPHADHTYKIRKDRMELLAIIKQWLRTNF